MFLVHLNRVLAARLKCMTLIELLILLVIAALCGGIGQALVGYTAGGCLTSMVVGIVGAYVGVWIARQLNLPLFLPLTIGDQSFPIIWSVIGSAIFSAALGLINRAIVGRRRY